MSSWTGVIAHQGGWDEALVALAPVALLAGLVWAATVAARRRAGSASGDGDRPAAP